jgi:hypothetical protein
MWNVRYKLISYQAKIISQQTDKISQQPENWENRNGPDLVQAFPKKWWVESDFTTPNLQLPLRLKGSSCHYNSIFNKNNKIGAPSGEGNYYPSTASEFTFLILVGFVLLNL